MLLAHLHLTRLGLLKVTVKYEKVQNFYKTEDIEKVLSLKRAYGYLLDWKSPLTAMDVLEINNSVRSGKRSAGKIRDEDVIVPMTNDVWMPPIPDKQKSLERIDQIINSPKSATERAADLNLALSRWQLFTNGNKRTAKCIGMVHSFRSIIDQVKIVQLKIVFIVILFLELEVTK